MTDGNTNPITTWFSNLLGGGVVTATLVGMAPAAAAVIAILWYLIQIYESRTVQRWLSQHRVRKLARLKARVIMLEAQGHPPLPDLEDGA